MTNHQNNPIKSHIQSDEVNITNTSISNYDKQIKNSCNYDLSSENSVDLRILTSIFK